VTWRLASAGGLAAWRAAARRAGALRAAGGAGAVLVGLGAGWAATALAPSGLAGSAGLASVRLVGALAVLLAAANGYSKAYSP
jgi:hypothetical protein